MASKALLLGFSIGHDASAAVLHNGQVLATCEEERFTRIKHDAQFPKQGIRFCLEAAQAKPKDVDVVTVSWHPTAQLARRLGFCIDPRWGLDVRRKMRYIRATYAMVHGLVRMLKETFPRAQIIPIEHHMAHAASTFFASPFDQAAVLTMDGHGEWSSGLSALAQGCVIKKRQESFFPKSLGMVYLAFTHYLGFKLHDEYKVMGLSGYGEPSYLDAVRRTFGFDSKRLFRMDPRYFQHPVYSDTEWDAAYYSKEFEKLLGPARAPGDPVEQRHKDIAKSLQVHFEDVCVEMARQLLHQTGQKDICLSGGVFLNGLANYQIKLRSGCRNLFVQPASNDGGTALGAVLFVWHQLLKGPRAFVMEHAYWGRQYADSEIQKELEICRLPYRRVENPADLAAQLLASGKIIGWFQGRAELGPRALGNRSILADPRCAENKDRVNARIKFREEFRPFAPAVLEEWSHEYFERCGVSPYMLLICPVKPSKQEVIPAVTHVDGTARPQTVSRRTNPLFYDLIHRFHERTGVPVVLNTSFNVKGEPIVNSPADAIRCFYSTGLDYLFMGSYLLSKNPNNGFPSQGEAGA